MNSGQDSATIDGLMFIGDPHLESRTPGFRKDNYPQVALEKFRWCLRHARENRLQPMLLGDLFQLPQDNPNWLLSEIIAALRNDETGQPLPAIYGNHDVRENSLKPNDSIHVLFAGGHLRRLTAESPWIGQVAGRQILVAGADWGEELPKQYADDIANDLVVWATHHDIRIPGYEEAGYIRPCELPGIDLVVNGHIHRRLAPLTKGTTHWVTAGNITRRARSDASRAHVPSIACLTPTADRSPPSAGEAHDVECCGEGPMFEFRTRRNQTWQVRWIAVPHEPFDAVFHPVLQCDDERDQGGSGFVADLRELTARRTDTGAGLTEYLQQHVEQFEAPVAAEILRLAAQVTGQAADKVKS